VDYGEESEDEDTFQNVNPDKYVDLKKEYKMNCVFQNKFKKWVPVSVVENNSRCVNMNDLLFCNNNQSANLTGKPYNNGNYKPYNKGTSNPNVKPYGNGNNYKPYNKGTINPNVKPYENGNYKPYNKGPSNPNAKPYNNGPRYSAKL
jgi:hypothetical protein